VSVARIVKNRAKKYAKHIPTKAPPACTAARPMTKAISGVPARGVTVAASGRSGMSGSPKRRPPMTMAIAAQT
jgi:hypothetical protein